MQYRRYDTQQNLPIVLPNTTSALPDRQSDPAISSLANPRTTTRLNNQQLDEPDCPDSNAICKQHAKPDNLVMGDADALSIDWEQRDLTDDDEEIMQELPTTDTDHELPNEESIMFKMPEKEAPRKTRKSRKTRDSTEATRRQKSRACKSALINYDVNFSDDAEVN